MSDLYFFEQRIFPVDILLAQLQDRLPSCQRVATQANDGASRPANLQKSENIIHQKKSSDFRVQVGDEEEQKI